MKLPHEDESKFELCPCLHCDPPEWYWKDKINIPFEELRRKAQQAQVDRLIRFFEIKNRNLA